MLIDFFTIDICKSFIMLYKLLLHCQDQWLTVTPYHLILGRLTQWKAASGQPRCNKGQITSRGNRENIIIYLPQNYIFIV